MEQQIKDRYSEAILQEAMRRYGIAGGQIRPLDAFESFIYEFEREMQACKLQLGSTYSYQEDAYATCHHC